MSLAIKDEIIVGFKDLKKLKVIPDGFPLRRIDPESTQIQALRNSLIRDFRNVLTDSLPDESMGGSPMKIFLTPGEKESFRISTARPVPHHWEEKAKKAIQQLIDSKVIATMSDPSDWCAPGFFVAKPNRELRLNFTGLNKYVHRPIHTFPSNSDIASGLDPQAQFFAKLDATQGYHQVPLDNDSSKLTTFLLPHSRFLFLRAPMGLSCSSDEFWCRSDEVICNLPGVRKLVDDIPIQAPTLEALKSRISELLQCCRTQHFTLSQKKSEIGRTVNFAGFVVSRDGSSQPGQAQGHSGFSSTLRHLFLALIPWHDKPAEQFLSIPCRPQQSPPRAPQEGCFFRLATWTSSCLSIDKVQTHRGPSPTPFWPLTAHYTSHRCIPSPRCRLYPCPNPKDRC